MFLSLTSPQIELLSGFDGFSCQPFWRQFPVDGTKENPYSFRVDRYIVRKEYNVRFFCTWSMADTVATSFNITFGDDGSQSQSWRTVGPDYPPLPLYAIPNGFVVPLNKAWFASQTSVGFLIMFLLTNGSCNKLVGKKRSFEFEDGKEENKKIFKLHVSG